MYEPADRPTLSLAFLWPAIAAATASNMAAAVFKNFTDLAMGADGPEVAVAQMDDAEPDRART